jgi:hypothetical protein
MEGKTLSKSLHWTHLGKKVDVTVGIAALKFP